MNRKRDDMDWIEDFLEGSLNADEEKEFQSRLKADHAFAGKYLQRLKLQETWQSSAEYQTVKTRIDQLIQEERSKIRYRRNILMIAASFIAVVGLASILLFVIPNKSAEQLKQAEVTADSLNKLNNLEGPQQIGIPKYGKSDTLPVENINEILLLLPADYAEFFKGDSIHFLWKSSKPVSNLCIKEKSTDSLIVNIHLLSGQSEYFLETSRLRTGNYIWFIDEMNNRMEFVVK
jgi:hypothetical protein